MIFALPHYDAMRALLDEIHASSMVDDIGEMEDKELALQILVKMIADMEKAQRRLVKIRRRAELNFRRMMYGSARRGPR